MEHLVGFWRFAEDFSDFGSILDQFWGPMLDSVLQASRLEIAKISFFVSFVRACDRDAVCKTNSRQFL